MDAGNTKTVSSYGNTVFQNSKRGMAKGVIGNGGSSILGFVFQTVCNDLAGKILYYSFVGRRIRIYDQGTVRRKKLGETPERMADVFDIFKKVQMICVNIKDDADLWKIWDFPTRMFP